MQNLNRIIKRIVTDHHTVMFIGVMLILMGCISLFEHFFENLLGIEFEVAYGYIFLGLFNILMAIAFIIMGTMNVETGLSGDEGPAQDTDARIARLEDKLAKLEEKMRVS